MENKKRFSIQGISSYRLIGYFVIYSILGFLLETIFAFVVYGKLESRQGFLYGPVCPIYGVGAVILIILLQRVKNNGYKLFFGGFILGSIVEYVVSLIGELIFNVRWWDYSNRFFNINGRICLLYSIYWGIISIFLIKELNVKIDKIIDWIKTKISLKVLKFPIVFIFVLLFLDFILSAFVIHTFLSKTIVENDINVKNRVVYEKTYNNIYKNQHIEKLMDKIWNENLIIKIYPNLKLTLEEGRDIMVQDYYKDVQPYYYKFER